MSAQSHFTRTLVAFAAALLVSSVAVGSAVGPAQVAGSTVSARA
jgi:F0F1-type ATP synthase membrane subunit c/vacuolar-type H+-ATPase subunit K